MGKKKIDEFTTSAIMNQYGFTKYLNRLKELAMSMFEWSGLPDTIDERFLELALFEQGKAVYFNDEVMGNLALRVTTGGNFNVYNVPTLRRAYASNGYQKQLNEKDSVIIWNNYLRTNTLYDMKYYAIRLWELDRIVDINAKAQKTPILIQCSEEERLTMTNLYMKYDGNQPFISGTKNLNVDGFKVLKTDAPYVCDRIMQLRNQIWNEALTELGISNLNIQKKERLVTDEAIRSQGGVIASRYSRLNERRKAADAINKMFGTNIEVNYREDYRQTDDEFMLEGKSGDDTANAMVIDMRTRNA